MRRLVAAVFVASVCVVPLAASALPGQRLATFLAWAKIDSGLHSLEHSHDGMTGGTTYSKDIRADGLHLSFNTEPGDGVGSRSAAPDEILGEETAVLDVPNHYDLRKHRDVAVKMAKIVYGARVAEDLRGATLAGDFSVYHSKTQRFSVLEGRLYGYQLSGPSLYVFELKHLREGLANARKCASVNCGD